MDNQIHTEEDFKKLLKSLVAEKKRVQTEDLPIHSPVLKKKFFSKLGSNSNNSFLSAYNEKFAEVNTLKGQLEKVKPALKKLIEELKASRDEIEFLKKTAVTPSEKQALEENLKRQEEETQSINLLLNEARRSISHLEQEKQVLHDEITKCKEELNKQDPSFFQNEIVRLENEVLLSKKFLEETAFRLEEEKLQLRNVFKEKEEEFLKRKEHDEREIKRFEEERQRLVEKLADSLSHTQHQNEIIQDLREEVSVFKRDVDESEKRWRNANEEAEMAKGKLSLATLDANHLHATLEKQLHEKVQKNEELKLQLEKALEEIASQRKSFATQLQGFDQKESEIVLLKRQLAFAQEEVQKSDQALLRTEYEAKIRHLENEFQSQIDKKEKEMNAKLSELQESLAKAHFEKGVVQEQFAQVEEDFNCKLAKKESIFEDILTKGYVKMKEFSHRHALMTEEQLRLEKTLHEKNNFLNKTEQELEILQSACQNLKIQGEEKEAEIRKAQQHLAKKVKENTILQDLLERQKIHAAEVQKALSHHKSEIERLQHHLNTQRMQEEKLQEAAKERSQAAERLAKEWEEKYISLYQESQGMKSQLSELQRMKKQNETLSTILSSLRQVLGQPLDSKEHETAPDNPLLSSREEPNCPQSNKVLPNGKKTKPPSIFQDDFFDQ